MKTKIIDLIKEYRAESERLWDPEKGYDNEFSHGKAVACDRFADELEKLLKESKP